MENNFASQLVELQHAIERAGFRAGLDYLNKRVPHRYTVTYRFDGEAFYAFELVDKLNQPMPVLFQRVPLEDSFCQYTVADGVFKTNNSLDDRRLDGHKHQRTVQSYIGLPLVNNFGDLYGTFCHLDEITHELSNEEHAFLTKAVSLLSSHLPSSKTAATK